MNVENFNIKSLVIGGGTNKFSGIKQKKAKIFQISFCQDSQGSHIYYVVITITNLAR